MLANKDVLNKVTSEFIDEFLQIIHHSFDFGLSATDKKANLAHAWSKKQRLFLDNETKKIHWKPS